MTEEQPNEASRRSVPARFTPLMLLGLRVAGYTLLEQQVSDQPVDQVAQACATDDAVTQEAVQSYVGLLLAVLEQPDVWGIKVDDLPGRVERHGAFWYRRTLESVQRQERALSARAHREHTHRTHEATIHGTMRPGQTADQLRSRKELDALPIDGAVASGLTDMLRSVGYHLAPEQVAGRSAAAIAQLCEPADAWPQQLVLLSIYSYLDGQHRESDMLAHTLELWRRYLLPDEGDSSSP